MEYLQIKIEIKKNQLNRAKIIHFHELNLFYAKILLLRLKHVIPIE